MLMLPSCAQDQPDQFGDDHPPPEVKAQFEHELATMIAQHLEFPSIIAWVVFNEGWGQYDTERIVNMTKALDPTRLADCASGWNDAPVGCSAELLSPCAEHKSMQQHETQPWTLLRSRSAAEEGEHAQSSTEQQAARPCPKAGFWCCRNFFSCPIDLKVTSPTNAPRYLTTTSGWCRPLQGSCCKLQCTACA